jgi:hypothetical protein
MISCTWLARPVHHDELKCTCIELHCTLNAARIARFMIRTMHLHQALRAALPGLNGL